MHKTSIGTESFDIMSSTDILLNLCFDGRFVTSHSNVWKAWYSLIMHDHNGSLVCSQINVQRCKLSWQMSVGTLDIRPQPSSSCRKRGCSEKTHTDTPDTLLVYLCSLIVKGGWKCNYIVHFKSTDSSKHFTTHFFTFIHCWLKLPPFNQGQ